MGGDGHGRPQKPVWTRRARPARAHRRTSTRFGCILATSW
ncbi:hypothetical protein AKJ09_03147 [Labilithrix luteola]|uniref:Uncharacterized protein n=1 Tax=Labilithrix luteola TaxID=1391654 RepID=A0A0K1PSH0_9BACT|nr:hypothetical protein AKJ09_03147 [Labilithrix luteola]